MKAICVVLWFSFLSVVLGAQGFDFKSYQVKESHGHDLILTSINNTGKMGGIFLNTVNRDRGLVIYPTGYRVMTAPNSVLTILRSVNSNMWVAGTNITTSGTCGFLLDLHSGLVRQFKGPNGNSIDTLSSNDFLQSVGGYRDGYSYHGFFRGADGKFTILNYPGSGTTEALAINNKRQIVGVYWLQEGEYLITHGFLYKDGQYYAIDFPGATHTTCWGINNNGHIVGTYNDSQYREHGFVLIDGKYLRVEYPSSAGTAALGINDSDQIVGGVQFGAAQNFGFLATPKAN